MDTAVEDLPVRTLVFGEASRWDYKKFPWQFVRQGQLKTKEPVIVRPATPLDIPEIQEYFKGLNLDDRYTRYFNTMSIEYLQSEQWLKPRYDETLDYYSHMAFLVATITDHVILGVCQAYRQPDGSYEVSYSRLSCRPEQGIGTLLMEAVIPWAAFMDAPSLQAQTFKDNEGMKRLFRKFKFDLSISREDPGLYDCVLFLPSVSH